MPIPIGNMINLTEIVNTLSDKSKESNGNGPQAMTSLTLDMAALHTFLYAAATLST